MISKKELVIAFFQLSNKEQHTVLTFIVNHISKSFRSRLAKLMKSNIKKITKKKRRFTAKQLRAQRNFARMARSGQLQKKRRRKKR